jgi:hypothetical protein
MGMGKRHLRGKYQHAESRPNMEDRALHDRFPLSLELLSPKFSDWYYSTILKWWISEKSSKGKALIFNDFRALMHSHAIILFENEIYPGLNMFL